MKRDIEKTYSRKAFAAKLRRLADALARGECFALQMAGRRVIVPRGVVFGIEHERDGADEEIELQMRWRTARQRKSRT